MNLPFLINNPIFFSFTEVEGNGHWHVVESFILTGISIKL